MSTLTKLYLNPLKRGAAKLLANPQAMHAAVRGAFPPDIDESQSRVLWRVDHREHEHVLYIVGPEKPDAQHIVEQAGWGTRPAQSADYSRFWNRLSMGKIGLLNWWEIPLSQSLFQGNRGEKLFHTSRLLSNASGY